MWSANDNICYGYVQSHAATHMNVGGVFFLSGCKETNGDEHSIFVKLMRAILLDGNGT